MAATPIRVSVYIDGFNLYFGMVEAGHINLKWLDVMELSKSCLKPGQQLVDVKYFTSTITNNPPKEKRQRTYLDAILSTGVKIFRGKYESETIECNSCNHSWTRHNEKMTDVNIATSLIMDAMNDAYDIAILISGDSDLVPAIRLVNENFAPKFVTVAFPPMRSNITVSNAATGSYPLGRKKLKDSQFPETVTSLSGYELKIPDEWK